MQTWSQSTCIHSQSLKRLHESRSKAVQWPQNTTANTAFAQFNAMHHTLELQRSASGCQKSCLRVETLAAVTPWLQTSDSDLPMFSSSPAISSRLICCSSQQNHLSFCENNSAAGRLPCSNTADGAIGREYGLYKAIKLGVGLLVTMTGVELCTAYSSICHQNLHRLSSNKIHSGDILALVT